LHSEKMILAEPLGRIAAIRLRSQRFPPSITATGIAWSER
jgi:hypothetical protein